MSTGKQKIVAMSMGKIIGIYEFVDSDENISNFISPRGRQLSVSKNINEDGSFDKVSGGIDNIQGVDYFLVTKKIERIINNESIIREITFQLREIERRIGKISSDTNTNSLLLLNDRLKKFAKIIYSDLDNLLNPIKD